MQDILYKQNSFSCYYYIRYPLSAVFQLKYFLNNWRRRNTSPPSGIPTGARRWRDQLVSQFGTPEQNPQFWNSISANYFLSDISGPLQLHHGTSDTSVPVAFSEKLSTELKEAGKDVELYTYLGDDHNISNNFSLAVNRSVAFFDKYLKP